MSLSYYFVVIDLVALGLKKALLELVENRFFPHIIMRCFDLSV